MRRVLLLLFMAALVAYGCGTPATIIDSKPGSNLNPAMTPAMRHAKGG